MQATTRLMARIESILKQFKKDDLPPELLGIRFENTDGAIDDGAATYNSYGKPMNDWQKSQQDDRWIPFTQFKDKP